MKAADKIDLYKLHKDEYAAAQKPQLVEIGKATYLTVDGQGAPGEGDFTTVIGALYGVAFTVKMTRKFAGEADYAVSKLEAQWWNSGSRCEFSPDGDKRKWRYKLMIRTPDFITADDVARAVAVLKKRGKGEAADRVRVESLSEGQCVQVLHVGPYDREATTIASMQAFVEGKNLRFDGRHHEIYLSDPRRVPPSRLKTILRHPVR